jgi:surfeit locus 1 family protein
VIATTEAKANWGRRGFAALMLALTVLFVWLGIWQWQRLQEKEALIATVADRMHRNPVDLPTPAMWPSLDFADFEYRPVTVTGTWLPDETVLVFTSLGDARGQYSGAGYWVMTPLALEQGGTVFINRGFVPQASRGAFAGGGAVTPGVVTLTGVGRLSEEVGSFTPGTDTPNRIEWVRNVERLARLVDPVHSPFAPVTLDLPSAGAGALPQGGETVVSFPNNHLGYAITWFGFALLTPILLAFWLRRGKPGQTP